MPPRQQCWQFVGSFSNAVPCKGQTLPASIQYIAIHACRKRLLFASLAWGTVFERGTAFWVQQIASTPPVPPNNGEFLFPWGIYIQAFNAFNTLLSMLTEALRSRKIQKLPTRRPNGQQSIKLIDATDRQAQHCGA